MLCGAVFVKICQIKQLEQQYSKQCGQVYLLKVSKVKQPGARKLIQEGSASGQT